MLTYIQQYFTMFIQRLIIYKGLILFYLITLSVSVLYIIVLMGVHNDYCGYDQECKDDFIIYRNTAAMFLFGYILYAIIRSIKKKKGIVKSMTKSLIGLVFISSIYIIDVLNNYTLCQLMAKYIRVMVVPTIATYFLFYIILFLVIYYATTSVEMMLITTFLIVLLSYLIYNFIVKYNLIDKINEYLLK